MRARTLVTDGVSCHLFAYVDFLVKVLFTLQTSTNADCWLLWGKKSVTVIVALKNQKCFDLCVREQYLLLPLVFL